MPSGRTNNSPESGRGLGHVTPTIFDIRSNISLKLLELETSNLVCRFEWAMPSGRTNNFPWKWAWPRSRDPYTFGSTVGYPSDSLASCYFASTINANAAIFWHENEAVFTHLVFADPGIKINGEYTGTCCWNRRCCPIYVQFLATSFFTRTVHPPAHWARETVALLQREVPSCIAANLRPPDSPDLNPVDYKMWGTMQGRAYYWAKV